MYVHAVNETSKASAGKRGMVSLIDAAPELQWALRVKRDRSDCPL